MKKVFLFASLLALVAVFATSCKDKVPAPKARFTAAADGLVVTFTNASKDAETYAWDFGDGSAVSAEKDPIHTYEKAGKYAVKLTAKNAAGEDSMTEEVEVAQKAFSIKVDGDFADWAEVPADALAEAKVDENATLEEVYDIKFCSTADFVYFYIEYNADEVGVMDIFINTDDDDATGHASWLWENSGADVLLEGEFDEEGVWSPDFFSFINGGDPSEWTWDALEATGALTVCAAKKLSNGHTALEGSLMRASLPNLKSFKVGVLGQGAGWSGETGALPETRIDDEGLSVVSPMLEVKLN